jgi:hypothetical protein
VIISASLNRLVSGCGLSGLVLLGGSSSLPIDPHFLSTRLNLLGLNLIERCCSNFSVN